MVNVGCRMLEDGVVVDEEKVLALCRFDAQIIAAGKAKVLSAANDLD